MHTKLVNLFETEFPPDLEVEIVINPKSPSTTPNINSKQARKNSQITDTLSSADGLSLNSSNSQNTNTTNSSSQNNLSSQNLLDHVNLIEHQNNSNALIQTQMVKCPQPIYNFGDVLNAWIEGDTFLLFIEACKDFCKKQLSSGLWIQEQMKHNSDLQNDLKETEKNPLVMRLPLENYLAAQMQHLTKYPMLIESILKKTKETSSEYEIIKEVKHELGRIILLIFISERTIRKMKIRTFDKFLLSINSSAS